MIIVGLVQGLTEFLPISSTGHIALVEYIFEIEDKLRIIILAHIGTLIAAIYFSLKHLNIKKIDVIKKLTITTIATSMIALLLKKIAVQILENPRMLSIGWFLTTAVLILISFKSEPEETNLTYKTAFVIGVFQGLSVIPGLSRSGSTILGGVLSGMKFKDATAYSFMASIPVIVLAVLYEFILEPYIENGFVPELKFEISDLVVITSAAISGVISMFFLLGRYGRKSIFTMSIYTLLLAFMSLNL
ncbi:MAG: undecaprenyl-diphosphate phosphatase [bacterium]|nr:undecaprenyl-diphosphate phosphatase [bacterium]